MSPLRSGAAWRRALVTGASSGLGRAFAERLATAGTDLVVVARRAPLLEDLAADLAERHGVDVEVLRADLTEPDDLRMVEERAAGPRRPIDLLVNNAGISATGRFDRIPAGRIQRVIDLNVRAVVRLTHAALPGMVERGAGAVLTVSSTAALQPLPYSAVYGASKAFVTSFSQALHEELRGTGVTVTVVCPGFVRTPMLGDAEDAIPDVALLEPQEVVGAALRGVLHGRALLVPGMLYRLQAATVRLVPTSLIRRGIGLLVRRQPGGDPT